MLAQRAKSLVGQMTGPSSKLSVAAGVNLFSTGIGTVGRFLMQYVLAQALGASGFGLYITMRRWSETLATLPNRGHNGTVVRFLPDYASSQDWRRYRGLQRYTAVLTATGSVLLGGIGAAVAYFAWPDHRLAGILAMVSIIGWAMSRTFQAVLQAQHQFVVSSLITQLLQPASMALVLTVVWYGWHTLNLTWVMVAMALSLLIYTALSWYFILQGTPPQAKEIALADSATRGDSAVAEERKRWDLAARSFYVGQLAIAVVGSADVLILSLAAPSATVGIYGMASRIALLGRTMQSGVDSTVAPRIASAWAARDIKGLQRTVDNAITLSFVPTLALSAALIVLRKPVLGVLGAEYVEASGVMVVLLIGIVVQALTGPCGYVVSLTNHERFHAATMVGAAVALVVGCFIAAFTSGMMAVALVTAAVNAGWNLTLVIYAKRTLGVNCFPTMSTLKTIAGRIRR